MAEAHARHHDYHLVDPELAKDSEHDGLATITLSYTMYPVRQSEPQRVGSAEQGLRADGAQR